MTAATPAERNLAAEIRFTEDGHHAIVQPGGAIKVVSDTIHHRWYEVTFHAGRVHDQVVFSCRPRGRDTYREGHLDLTGQPGVVPCKHAAGAARRLEREGFVRCVDGLWVAAVSAAAPAMAGDPFSGLT